MLAATTDAYLIINYFYKWMLGASYTEFSGCFSGIVPMDIYLQKIFFVQGLINNS